MEQSILSLLKRLWLHVSPHRRWQFLFLLILMFLTSLTEVISIGAVLPFLAILTTPSSVFESPLAQPVLQFFGWITPNELLLPITIVFVAAIFIAGCMRLLLLWASSRLSFATGADLSMQIYRRTLYQPYLVHCCRNSSEIINAIANKTGNTISIIINVLSIISSAVMLFAVLATLLSINPSIALLAFMGFGLIYVVIIRLTRKLLVTDSNRIAQESTYVIKSLQEGLGGIRDVLIDGSQEVYCRIYRAADLALRRAQGRSQFIAGSPRYGMEALGMMLIAIMAYSLSIQNDGIGQAIPILGALALGAQRLLPVLQQAYASWSGIRSSQVSLIDTLVLLDQPLPEYIDAPTVELLSFDSTLSLKNVGFRYGLEMPYVLKNLTFSIKKGSRIGFIGATGSGKSTLLDIIMGLLEPTEGTLAVDDNLITSSNCRAWQDKIAHVPQMIFLADSTIEENIAFGVPKERINSALVRRSAEQAQIANLIKSWPHQYKTFVGERGIKLSGGQRQRIGIARALYKQAEVIIFDEATSALDNETEDAVMKAIEELNENLTVLIIAHRLTTLKECTEIVELENGKIKRIGNYSQIVGLTK
jgi:ATP-binding cassette subfamily B protein